MTTTENLFCNVDNANVVPPFTFRPIEPANVTTSSQLQPRIYSPRPSRQGSENFVLTLTLIPRDPPVKSATPEQKK